MPDYDSILDRIRALSAEVLGVSPNAVPVDAPFDRLGLASRDAVMLSGDLQDWLGCELPATLLYDHPTPGLLAAFLAEAPGVGGEARPRGSESVPSGVARAASPLALEDFEEGRI